MLAPAFLALITVILIVVVSHEARCNPVPYPDPSDSRHLSGATNDTWEAFPLPAYRCGAGLVTDPTNGDLYLFGGYAGDFTNPDTYFNDLEVYNRTRDAWALAPHGTAGPGKREGARMAIDGAARVIFLYGGYFTAGTWYQDIWAYDIAAGAWTEVTPDAGFYADAMGYSGSHLLAFQMGSFGASTLYDYDLSTGGHTSSQPSNWINPTRRWFGWDYDAVHERFFIFGGCEYYAGEYRFYNDLWVLDAAAGTFERRASLPMAGRESMGVAYSPKLDGIYVYGGTESNIDSNWHAQDDLWAYSYASDSWTLVQDAAPPGREYYNSLAYDPVHGLVHLYCINTCGPFEFWSYDVAGGTWDDNQDANGPGRLSGASLAASGGSAVVFGGMEVDSGAISGLTWEFNATARIWRILDVAVAPSARCRQQTAFDTMGGMMYIYGGDQGNPDYVLTELWSYNVSQRKWEQLPWPYGSGPRMMRPALAYSEWDGSLYAFGGVNWTNGHYSSELWRYDLVLQAWSLVSEGGPPARSESTMSYMRQQRQLVLFGGRNETATLNDLWLYDLRTGTWAERSVPGTRPPPRRSHAADYDPLVEHLYVSGGYGSLSWPYSPLSDLWYYCFEDGAWVEVHAAGAPGARASHGLRLDLWDCELYLFGGDGQGRGIWRLPLTDRLVSIFPAVSRLYAQEDSEFVKGFTAMGRPPLTWSFATNASWLSWNSTGRFLVGTPDNRDVGRFWVNITATDPIGDSGFLNLTLVVNNTPPAITTRDITDTMEDSPYSVDYNCTDDGQGNVTWYLTSAAEAWLAIDPATGVLSGTPDDKDVGTFTVIVSVHDGNGGWARTTFHLVVTNVNEPPTITTIPPARVLEDVGYVVPFAASDPDPTGDVLTWSLATNATFLALHPNSGVLSGTPSNDDVGTYYVEVSVSDGKGGVDRLRYNLTVENVNDPPYIAVRPGTIAIDEDDSYAGLDLNAWFKDTDRDALRFWSDAVVNVTVTIGPDGMAKLAPGPDWCGDASITFHATDGEFEANDSLMLTVRPVNDAPRGATITLVGTPFIEGGAQRALGDATDPDVPFGDELRFLWYTNATGRVAVGRDVNLSLPAGTYRLTLNVTDLEGAFSTASVDLVVRPKPSAPPPTDNGTGGGGGGGGKKREQGPLPRALGILALLMVVAIVVVALVARRSRGGKGLQAQGDAAGGGGAAPPGPIDAGGPGGAPGEGDTPTTPAAPAVCPRCGQAVPTGASAGEWCPSCGTSLHG